MRSGSGTGGLCPGVALRTLHEIFSATPPDVFEAVSFAGHVTTIDRATGHTVRPVVLSVSAQRSAFAELVLAAVEPAMCLARMNAVMTPIWAARTPRPPVSRRSSAPLPSRFALGGAQYVHQLPQGLQIEPGFLLQRCPVVRGEVDSDIIVPVLQYVVPRVLEQAELLVSVLVRPAVIRCPGPGGGGRPRGSR